MRIGEGQRHGDAPVQLGLLMRRPVRHKERPGVFNKPLKLSLLGAS